MSIDATAPRGADPAAWFDEIDTTPPRGAPAGVWFDEDAAQAACDFFPRYLRHTEAEWAGKPFRLASWQTKIVRAVFGWKLATGERLYREVYIEVGRKNGKTEFAAGLALLMLVGDGEMGGQVYSGAVDEDQAKIVLTKAASMVGMSDELSRLIEIFKTSLYCPELISSFKPLSATPSGKHGFSPSASIYDEIHAWRNGMLADVVHKGTGARRQPLEIYITTAGINGYGFGWEMHDRAIKVRDGVIEDPKFLPVIFAAEDDDDWTAEETWAKANPNLDVSIKREYLRDECRKAQESPRKENDFKRYHLNLWTEQVVRWITHEDWRACIGTLEWQELPEHLAGRHCFAAVDLSTKLDITALLYAFPPEATGEPWYLSGRFFVPGDNVRRRVERDRVPYDEWARLGAIELTEGNVVDYAWVERALAEDAARFEITEVAFDPWNAMQFATRMQDEGMTMVEHRQGYGSMSEPSKEFERLVVGHQLAHGGHPVLKWMAANVAVRTDPAGNIKPDKEKSGERIDGIVAAIMAIGRATVAGAPVKSVYETRGVLAL